MAEQDDVDAARAITDYRTLDYAARKLAWLELQPLTGRTHQLRVHCAALGAPILGDTKYGTEHNTDERGPRNVAVVENATAGTALALSSFDLRPGDKIVTSRSDYPSHQIMYWSLGQRFGVETVIAAERPEGGVDPESVRQLVRDPRCRLVALTWVPTNSGLVQAAAEVGEVCASAGVPFLVDACQCVGQMAIDVGRLRCDFLSASARKFMRRNTFSAPCRRVSGTTI